MGLQLLENTTQDGKAECRQLNVFVSPTTKSFAGFNISSKYICVVLTTSAKPATTTSVAAAAEYASSAIEPRLMVMVGARVRAKTQPLHACECTLGQMQQKICLGLHDIKVGRYLISRDHIYKVTLSN